MKLLYESETSERYKLRINWKGSRGWNYDAPLEIAGVVKTTPENIQAPTVLLSGTTIPNVNPFQPALVIPYDIELDYVEYEPISMLDVGLQVALKNFDDVLEAFISRNIFAYYLKADVSPTAFPSYPDTHEGQDGYVHYFPTHWGSEFTISWEWIAQLENPNCGMISLEFYDILAAAYQTLNQYQVDGRPLTMTGGGYRNTYPEFYHSPDGYASWTNFVQSNNDFTTGDVLKSCSGDGWENNDEWVYTSPPDDQIAAGVLLDIKRNSVVGIPWTGPMEYYREHIRGRFYLPPSGEPSKGIILPDRAPVFPDVVSPYLNALAGAFLGSFLGKNIIDRALDTLTLASQNLYGIASDSLPVASDDKAVVVTF